MWRDETPGGAFLNGGIPLLNLAYPHFHTRVNFEAVGDLPRMAPPLYTQGTILKTTCAGY